MALKYDSEIVVQALEKAQNILYYAKGDCRNTRAMDFLDDCIDGMNTWIANAKPRPEEPVINSSRQIKSSVRDDFARGLQNIMKEKHAEFADGTLEDNMVDIYDNYVSQYYEEELKEEGGEAVAEDWFRNTYYDDEEGIFIHNSRKPIKSSRETINGYDCIVVDRDYVDDHDLYFSDYVTDNDVVEWSLFHDDEDTYYAVKGEY